MQKILIITKEKCLLLLLLLLVSFSQVMAQGINLKGKVTDETGGGLPGVTVLLKGTTNGTATDAEGNFALTVPDATGTLVITFIGYTTQEVPINNRTTLNVSLKPDAKALEEVVVIGYATVARRDVTGSVASVGAQQIKDVPVNSAAEALTGRLAGVQVTAAEGTPGANVQIRVRGGGSITQDNSPLYVVDGIQVENALSVLSPQDIESVDVLKDAAATAIYGARGANGVVIITTKGGKEMKTTVTYNGFTGMRQVANKLGVLDPYQFVVYQYERTRGNAENQASFARSYGTTWDTLNVYRNSPFMDWQEQVFGRNAIMQTHNVSVAGGSKATKFNLSLSRNDEQGVMINSDFNRNLLNFRFDHNASDKFRFGLSVRYNQQEVNGAGTASEGSSSTNRLRNSVRYRPLQTDPSLSPEDFDPAYFEETNAAGNNLGIINPFQLSNAEYRRSDTRTTNLGGYLHYDFTKYLSFRTTVGTDISNAINESFDDVITSVARQNSNQPLAGIQNNTRRSLNLSNVLSFSNAKFTTDFHKNNRFDALVGQEIYILNQKYVDNQLRYFPVGVTPERALGQLTLGQSLPLNPSSLETESRILSFFGRANYSFKDRYLATLTFRADGSSKFARANRWGLFPAASLAWRFSEESFMKDFTFITDAKLRLSYGATGNNRINDFLYLTTFSTNQQYGLNEQINTAYVSNSLANPNLVWETTVTRNIGLDLAFLRNRFQFTADVYSNSTKDLLIQQVIPQSSGYTSQLQNIGSTTNSGVELQLNASVIEKTNFTWNSNFNIGFNRNKVNSLGEFINTIPANSGWSLTGQPDFIVEVGKPVGNMYGLVTDGFYTVDDFNYDAATRRYTLKPGVANNASVMNAPAQPGGVKFKDLDGDGLVTFNNDRTIIGNAFPKFTGGLNQQFTYKNFDLSAFFNFTVGNDVLNANKIEFTNGYNVGANLLDIMENRWRTVNDEGVIIQQVVSGGGGVQFVEGIAPAELAEFNKNATIWQPIRSGNASFIFHSWAVEDGSFLRINNITLGYTLPTALVGRAKINRLRVYGTVNNLAVFTNYSGYDPEVNTRRRTPLTPGVDYSAYPRSRAFILGVNLSL